MAKKLKDLERELGTVSTQNAYLEEECDRFKVENKTLKKKISKAIDFGIYSLIGGAIVTISTLLGGYFWGRTSQFTQEQLKPTKTIENKINYEDNFIRKSQNDFEKIIATTFFDYDKDSHIDVVVQQEVNFPWDENEYLKPIKEGNGTIVDTDLAFMNKKIELARIAIKNKNLKESERLLSEIPLNVIKEYKWSVGSTVKTDSFGRETLILSYILDESNK